MAKINITKPTGNETYNLISAFKESTGTYVIFDSEKIGSMGLPIIYISKYNDKLENITDDAEWQNVKNYLKGIINGTNFEYINIPDNVSADEAYYKPLTLPQASFDLIKSRYVVKEDNTITSAQPLEPAPTTINDLINEMAPANVEPTIAPVPITPSVPEAPSVVPTPAPPVAPVIPNNDVSNNIVTPIPNIESNATELPPIENTSSPMPAIEPAPVAPISVPSSDNSINDNIFDTDKETFIKACENMFDALVSKYQNKLNEINRREEELKLKEQEINNKMASATEHLANAEAREQVANIAHDNAQRVMDLNGMMPNNPNEVQAGVI